MAEAPQACIQCGKPVYPELRSYRYAESGLPNVVLSGVEVSDCAACDNSDVAIPRMGRIHSAIARALVKSPTRLTGPELRFLRKHLGQTGEQFAAYLHTDKTKISKWERGEDRIGPANDRLVRLLVAALDKDISPEAPLIAASLPLIADSPGADYELHIDVLAMTASFCRVSRAA